MFIVIQEAETCTSVRMTLTDTFTFHPKSNQMCPLSCAGAAMAQMKGLVSGHDTTHCTNGIVIQIYVQWNAVVAAM